VSLPVATGLGEGRNLLVVQTVDVVIAIGRSAGTLSEIALAARAGKPVILLESYARPEDLVPDAVVAATPREAVDLALRLLCQG
jgi:hypothetical protein